MHYNPWIMSLLAVFMAADPAEATDRARIPATAGHGMQTQMQAKGIAPAGDKGIVIINGREVGRDARANSSGVFDGDSQSIIIINGKNSGIK